MRILVLGDAQSDEMRPVSEAISSKDELRVAPNVVEALQLSENEWFPDLAIVCQNWPDEFSNREVASLLDVFPLARLVCCYGFWCESDGRNRDIWPPATRIAVRASIPRIRREMSVLQNRLNALPITAGRDEVFAFDCPGDLSPASLVATIGVTSPDRSLSTWLRELLEAAGYQTRVNETGHQDVLAVVWDTDPLTVETCVRLGRFNADYPGIPVVSLMNAAISSDAEKLAGFGINTIVPKLASHELLLETLARELTSQ